MDKAAFEETVREVMQLSTAETTCKMITVALSGGADSVALCLALLQLREQLGITLQAAHLNHGLRGAESDADEAFVRRMCDEWGIPLITERLHPFEAAPSEGTLREMRYAFLWKAAGDGLLVTGHTLTDSCESLLLHLARGSSLGGLRGVPERQGRLVRPLIHCTRADTEAYCRQSGAEYVTDSSNLSPLYARNRLRQSAMPALESVNPQAQRAMERWMTDAQEIYALLEEQAEQLLQKAATQQAPRGPRPIRYADKVHTDASMAPERRDPPAAETVYEAAVLRDAPDVLLRQALAQLLRPFADCSEARLQRCVAAVRDGGAVNWCSGVRLRCAEGYVWLENTGQRPPTEKMPFCAVAQPGIYDCAPGVTVAIRQKFPERGTNCRSDAKTLNITHKINKKDLKNPAEYDTINVTSLEEHFPGEAVQLRFRQPQDRYCFSHGKGTKTLKKWLYEIGCPPAERERLPLLAVGSQVIWLSGSGTAEDYRPNEKAENVWEIKVYRDTEEQNDDGNGKRDPADADQ